MQAAHGPNVPGVKNVTVCFSMTETHSMLCWDSKRDGSALLENRVRTGGPTPGTRIRICEPRSREPVMRWEISELYNGDPRVLASYPSADSSVFYKDPRNQF